MLSLPHLSSHLFTPLHDPSLLLHLYFLFFLSSFLPSFFSFTLLHIATFIHPSNFSFHPPHSLSSVSTDHRHDSTLSHTLLSAPPIYITSHSPPHPRVLPCAHPHLPTPLIICQSSRISLPKGPCHCPATPHRVVSNLHHFSP